MCSTKLGNCVDGLRCKEGISPDGWCSLSWRLLDLGGASGEAGSGGEVSYYMVGVAGKEGVNWDYRTVQYMTARVLRQQAATKVKRCQSPSGGAR